MKIVDSHFHWWPRKVFEDLCKRKDYPRAEPDDKGGFHYYRHEGADSLNVWTDWFYLDKQLEYMDGLGHDVDVVCSIGPFSVHFSDLPAAEGRDAAMAWNEHMAGAQKEYPGRVWASAAIPCCGLMAVASTTMSASMTTGSPERVSNPCTRMMSPSRIRLETRPRR